MSTAFPLPSARRLCNAFSAARSAFGADVVTAPAVELLLHLHAEEKEGRAVSTTELAKLVGVSDEVAWRWLRVLCEKGLATLEVGHCSTLTSSYRITQTAERRLDELLQAVGL